MINVITVKFGPLYGPEYVNRVYKMVCRNLTIPFKFYCYTDDSTGLDDDIIPIVETKWDLQGVWNKLALFQPGLFEGKCLYFDLDIAIQNNIDCLAEYPVEKDLTWIRCWWKEKKNIDAFQVINGHNHRNVKANSSVMLWHPENVVHIWEDFIDDSDFYMCSLLGIDRFLMEKEYETSAFPKGWIYSRLAGIDEQSSKYRLLQQNDKVTIISNGIELGSIGCFYYPDSLICIFNGIENKKLYYYNGFEKYWS